MHFDRIRHVAEIGRDADLDAFGVEAEADRIDGVVRDGEALDRDIADHPARAGLKMLDRRRFNASHSQSIIGAVRRETKTGRGFFFFARAAHQPRQTRHMIGMLVRDDDGVEIFRLLADLRQAPRQFPHAQTRVDQNARLRSGEERRVSRTAARQYAEYLNDNNSPSFCFSRRTRRTQCNGFCTWRVNNRGQAAIFVLMTSTSSCTAPELLCSAAVSSSVSLIS